MGADILDELELMRFTRIDPIRENAILKRAKDEIVRLRGEVAMTEQQKAGRDLLLTGTSFMRDGKRIDPATVRIETPAPAMPNGVEAARVLADFAETAPGRLPGRVQEAIATIRAADNRDAAGVEESAALYGMFRALVDAGGATSVARYGGEKRAEALADALQRGMFAIEHRFNPERFDEFPVGALAPAAVPAGGEAVAVGPLDLSAPPKVWLQIDPNADADDRSDQIERDTWELLTWHHESIGGQEVAYIRADLATPPAAQVQGEAVAYLEVGPGGYLDLGTDRSDDSLLSMPPGKYMLGIIGHPSGDAVGAALRFLGELETVGNARAGEVARGLRKVVANPSACELGAVRELVARWRQRWESLIDRGRLGDGYRVAGNNVKLCADELEAALQHRGDSQEVGRG